MNWEVTAAPTVEPITADEAVLHCRLDNPSPAEIAEVEGWIRAARTYCENALDLAIPAQEITAYAPGFADRMTLPMANLLEVVSVQYLDAAGALQPLNPAAYRTSKGARPAYIYRASGQSWPDTLEDDAAVTITYRAGFAVIPEDIKQAVKLLVGSYSEHRETTVLNNVPAEIGHAVTAILHKYRRMGV